MAETIRANIKRRTRLGFGVILGSVALFGAVAWLYGGKPPLVTGIAWFAVYLVGAIIVMQSECPRCSTVFGRAAVYLTFRLGGKRIDACPSCGVSLDEPFAKRNRSG